MDAARSTCVRNGWQLLPEAFLSKSEGNWCSAEVTVYCVLWRRCAGLILSPQRFHGCRECSFKCITPQKGLEKRLKIRVSPRVHRKLLSQKIKRKQRGSRVSGLILDPCQFSWDHPEVKMTRWTSDGVPFLEL